VNWYGQGEGNNKHSLNLENAKKKREFKEEIIYG